MNDFMARWVLTAGILCLLPDLNGSHVIQFLKTAIRCRASNNLAGDDM